MFEKVAAERDTLIKKAGKKGKEVEDKLGPLVKNKLSHYLMNKIYQSFILKWIIL